MKSRHRRYDIHCSAVLHGCLELNSSRKALFTWSSNSYINLKSSLLQSLYLYLGPTLLAEGRRSKLKIKSMLICFLDSQGVVHKKFVPLGQTVNKQYYREFLERLRKRVHRVRPEIADTWALHHDKAPCHTAISMNEFLTKNCIPAAPQPP